MTGIKRGRQAASLLSKSISIPYPSSDVYTINRMATRHPRGRIKRDMNMCSSKPGWYTTSSLVLILTTLLFAAAPASITARLIVASKTAKITAATIKGPSVTGTVRTTTATSTITTTPMNDEPPDRKVLARPTFLTRSSRRIQTRRNHGEIAVNYFLLKQKSGDPAENGFEQKYHGVCSHHGDEHHDLQDPLLPNTRTATTGATMRELQYWPSQATRTPSFAPSVTGTLMSSPSFYPSFTVLATLSPVVGAMSSGPSVAPSMEQSTRSSVLSLSVAPSIGESWRQPSIAPSNNIVLTPAPSMAEMSSSTGSPSRAPSQRPTVRGTASPRPTLQGTDDDNGATTGSTEPTLLNTVFIEEIKYPSDTPSFVTTTGNPTRATMTEMPTFTGTVFPTFEIDLQEDDESRSPSMMPTAEPTPRPTRAPVPEPTPRPTQPPVDPPQPTKAPVDPPSKAPVKPPTRPPIDPPTEAPVAPPTTSPIAPTPIPTVVVTAAATSLPTSLPIVPIGPADTPPPVAGQDEDFPSTAPSDFNMVPYLWPSIVVLTYEPSGFEAPVVAPTTPVAAPSRPSSFHTPAPVVAPSRPDDVPVPVPAPVVAPTRPISFPTLAPAVAPTRPISNPTPAPVVAPTRPFSNPTPAPVVDPTPRPARVPTPRPVVAPSPIAVPTAPVAAPSGPGSPTEPDPSPFTYQPTERPGSVLLGQPTPQPNLAPIAKEPPQTPSPISSLASSGPAPPTPRPSLRLAAQPTLRPSAAPSPRPSVWPTTRSPSSSPSDSPTAAPSHSPSSSPSVSAMPSTSQQPSSAPTPVYEFEQNINIMEGIQNILSFETASQGQIRVLQNNDLNLTTEDCDELYTTYVAQRIENEVETVIAKYETLKVELYNVTKKSHRQANTLVYTYDARVAVRSIVQEHDMNRYVAGPFDSQAEQDAFVQYLRQTGCPDFRFVTGIKFVLPELLDAEPLERDEPGPNTSGVITGVVTTVAATTLLIAVIVVVRMKSRFTPIPLINENETADPGGDEDLYEIGVLGNDDVSTLGNPLPLGMQENGALDTSTVDSISLNYDYKKAYHYSPSRMSGSVRTVSDDQSRSPNMIVTTDDDTIGAQYAAEEQFEVVAPPGVLGLILETTIDGIPIVNSVKPGSILADEVQVGDRLLSVDGKDVTVMLASNVSRMIAQKKDQPERRFIFSRPPTNSTSSKMGQEFSMMEEMSYHDDDDDDNTKDEKKILDDVEMSFPSFSDDVQSYHSKNPAFMETSAEEFSIQETENINDLKAKNDKSTTLKATAAVGE